MDYNITKMSEKPGKPTGVINDDTNLLISWYVSAIDLQSVDSFEIQWKKKEEKRWPGRKNTDDNSTSITIPSRDLEKNTAYQFKVSWITTEGVVSPFSDISDDIIIKMSQKPGKPKVVETDDAALIISWDVPSSNLQSVDIFEIQWKKPEGSIWSGRKCTEDNSTSVKIPITELEKNTTYQFAVRWITRECIESPFSDVSDDIAIKMSQKPGKPKRVNSNDADLVISWDVPSSDLQAVDYFEIQWKKKEERRWSGLKRTPDNSTSIVIQVTDFEQNATYHFKVKWITKNGEEGPCSDISDDVPIIASIPTRSSQQPGKVSSSQTTATTACLVWEKPKGSDEVSYYEVKYRTCGEVQWLSVHTDHPTERLDLKELKSKNDYEFKVRAIFTDGNEGPFSEVSDTVTTQESLAKLLKNGATKVGMANPQRYKIPLIFSKEMMNASALTRKGRFGERDQLHSTKTIMVVGATGAGKSTLIDGMINYILDVAWEDDFRFTMIDLTEDETVKAHDQAKSQTNWITCYEVNYQPGSRLKYNLNIIDTPGFGDTRGIEQDKKIVDQIREFFTAPGDKGIDSIDAVCFITQAPLARLTHTQTYIFDAILSIFGKDVKDNIFVLITFADGKEPAVLAALKEANVPFMQSFTFNNSALFACTNSSEQFGPMFWKLGITSFDNFFAQLNNVQKKSLKLTSEVLVLRNQIENTIDNLQRQIRDGLQELNIMKKETEVLETHKRDIEANRNFTYKTQKIEQRKVMLKPGECVTNCYLCHFTCHLGCPFVRQEDKHLCYAMQPAGYCKECPKNCHWSNHISNDFYFETYVIEEEKTYENLKAKYEIAIAGEKKQTSVLGSIKSAFKSLGQKVMGMVGKVSENINKLEESALKPNPLSEVNYVNLLIESEKREAKKGWEDQVNLLEGIKMKATILQGLPTGSLPTCWTDKDVETFLEKMSTSQGVTVRSGTGN